MSDIRPAPLPSPHADVLFAGEGEMARLCRELDWAATPLGPVEGWPQSLRTAAGMVVAQGIAQALCWGPDLVQVYNDGYRVIMRDKHPAGLGRSVYENWSEIRGDIEPLFRRVLAGETVYFEDLAFLAERDGRLENAYFTFSYSPVRVESGEVGGALINCFETTAQVHSRALQAERDRLLESLQFEQSRLEYVFQHAPAFLAVLRGPRHTFHIVNEAYYQLVGHRQIIGKAVTEALPEVADQGYIELLDAVLRTGEPFVGSEMPLRVVRTAGAAREEEVFIDLTYLPLVEPGGERTGVIAHGYDVTQKVLARRQVERLLGQSEAARHELEAINRALHAQRTELEVANTRLQENAAEMEMQTEELQQAASALQQQTAVAEAARLEAERVREHLARVIEQAPVAMYIATGREHVFDVVNAPYYAMVGRRPDEMIGRPGREVFPELVSQGVFEIIERVYDTGVPFRAAAIPAMLRTGPGDALEAHYFNLVYQPLHDHRGVVYAIALVATEVTELVHERERAETAQRDAEAARMEAEAANRAKSDFLASMSHELRTPLNAIGGYTELMEMGIHGPVTEAQRGTLERVQSAQRHLLTLINDILSFARIEAGQVEFAVEPLGARPVLTSLEALIGPQAQAKGIHYEVQTCARDLVFAGDEERVRQVLLNLVGNAIKFTESGGRVVVCCDADDEWVYLRVEDNGRGIPPEKLETIFDPFTQVDRRLDQPQGGVGLGLAISRDLARAMSGDLNVRSTPGEGSTFTLRLPRIAE